MSLGLFHYREKKPQAWAVFDASKKAYEEMLEDTDCLAGLQAITDAIEVKRSVEREYEFPMQYTKMTSGKSASILSLEGQIKTVQILELDPKMHRITLKIGGAFADYLSDKLDLLPPMPINTNVIENAIYSLIQQLCAGTASPATVDLLERNAPNLADPSEPAQT